MSALATGPTIFIQPYYDNVPFSCGSTVAALARGGHGPRIATVFASEILDATVGGFTASKHSRWRLTDPNAVLAAQMQRDAEAAQTFGFSVRWLGLPDAIYRGDRYTSDRELFGPLQDEEHARADHLSEEIRHLPEWRDGNRVLVPLVVGSHADH